MYHKKIAVKPYIMLPRHRLMIKWLRHRGHSLSKWELTFLKDIKRKQKLTHKQLCVIENMYMDERHSSRDFIIPEETKYNDLLDIVVRQQFEHRQRRTNG